MVFGALLIAAFLIGSIPFGYLIGRFIYGTDIRATGSGNIGAMNAMRSLGKRGAVAVLVLDALKGFIPVVLMGRFVPSDLAIALAASLAVVGHCYSPWLGFKGGKGVATSVGALFGIAWPLGLIAIGGWVVGAAVTRYSSVGSMLAVLIAIPALWFFTHSPVLTVYGVLIAGLIVYAHRENIERLRAGTENRIRLGKTAGSP
ncbi:MAG: glycerol-3-phosphate 1-O-acyltransferase PlsY [Candidatus Eremiobacteraeota bacterium]|nr:glycerol-3-phosphate 1-O-acyltransferase PlsY [Candidatus Eremiobacteraeota bacterium]